MANHATLSVDHQMTVYQQNAETFRSLNQLMWQIPLIAMTLTGGLWFGVSRADTSPVLQLSLLGLAAVGNTVLIVVLGRLRYIMGQYLVWLETFYPEGFVGAPGAPGGRGWEKPATVRTMFQLMLALAAGVSVILMATTAGEAKWFPNTASHTRAVAFYDRNAVALADSYEGLSFAAAHPELFATLSGSAPLRILDIGAGTGRDAAAMAELGHAVTAVEPSAEMRKIARSLHPAARVEWRDDALPSLSRLTQDDRFDVILMSAVWMHVPPRERVAAFDRLTTLLASGGRLYITLRIGPAASERAIFPVSQAELEALAKARRMTTSPLSQQADLLARPDVSWRSLVISSDIIAKADTAPKARAGS